MKSYEQLEFYDDFMFCKIMTNYPEICREVIEALLEIKIKKINYLQKQKAIDESFLNKGIRLDIYAETEDKIIDVEIQTYRKQNLGLRTRYYQSIIDSENLAKGKDYEDLRELYIIFICLDDPFKEKLPVYYFKTLCTNKRTLQLSDKCTKIFFNCSAWPELPDTEQKHLLSFLTTSKPNSPLTQKIKNAIVVSKKQEKWRSDYMVWNLALNDAKKQAIAEGKEEGRLLGLEEGRSLGIEEGRTQGLEEGRSQGLEEGRSQGLEKGEQITKDSTIKRMLLRGCEPDFIAEMNDVSVDYVIQLQGKN